MIYISSYGSNTKNGAHCMAVQVGELHMYFSYRACVAYRYPGDGLVISEHEYGRTTEKHIATIKAMGRWVLEKRDKFKKMLQRAQRRNIINLAQTFLTGRLTGQDVDNQNPEEIPNHDNFTSSTATDQPAPERKSAARQKGDLNQTEYLILDGSA